ncbi:hypothetical protein TEA_019040 [Camellia sinensis var. sinensis]|uniref:Gibberellin-regulated protein 14 n=1 Tax=Camellia sinensis var. sinensis TaxID=542762 RepID=A0A4S4ES39_CAMSN|nr:hypothetical protein TEA_019040 [Camellia sinensis var. sinensis]
MAMKAMLFVLAYMLVLTTKAMAHAPAYAPAKTPPVLTPKKAPAYAPMPLVYPPVKSESPEPPVLTPKKAPAYAPMPHVYPPVKSESPEPPKFHGFVFDKTMLHGTLVMQVAQMGVGTTVINIIPWENIRRGTAREYVLPAAKNANVSLQMERLALAGMKSFTMELQLSVSCNDEEFLTEATYAKVLVPAPAHSPVKAPVPAQVPVKAPATIPPVKPPVLPAPPVNEPPTKPPPRTRIECIPLCVERCKLHSRKRLCLRACMTCCDRCKCVPPGTYGNREQCGKCYTDMTTHGGKFKCP